MEWVYDIGRIIICPINIPIPGVARIAVTARFHVDQVKGNRVLIEFLQPEISMPNKNHVLCLLDLNFAALVRWSGGGTMACPDT
jgi:hypothetical protein